jgi:hypothetical protein
MDKRSIVLYLHLKGLLAHAIHGDLVATLGPKAMAYSTVTRCLGEAKVGTVEVALDPEPGSHRLDNCDPVVMGALAEKPSLFSRELARPTHVPRATVSRRLTKSLMFVQRLLRWAPRYLSDAQMVRHVELSLSLLRMLKRQEQRAWHDVLTLDES